MITPLEVEREKRYEKNKDKYIFVVENHEEINEEQKAVVKTEFNEIENVLHKVKLDLMTMAHYGQVDGDKFFIKIFLKRK